MEWEPIFILGVTGGAMLVSVVRGVIGSEGRARPAAAAGSRRAPPPEIGDLMDRVETLEWLAAPAARAAEDKDRLRRGAA